MTAPRLTRFGRISHTSHVYVIRMMRKDKAPLLRNRISRPSPAEKRKARHLARAKALRLHKHEDDAGMCSALHAAHSLGYRAALRDLNQLPPSLPPSRGTTHGQLLQMYHESEGQTDG